MTLIPKVINPTLVSQYRHIACCNVRYKMVSKILTRRLQNGVGSAVDPTELVKGYGRVNMTPRCMIKIYLRKAYDSLK